MRYNLGGIIEKNTESTVGKLVSETVFGAEIDELGDEFVPGLLSALADQLSEGDLIGHCRLNLS